MNTKGLEPGVLIHDYELISVLGQGGMGRVYLARDNKLDCEVALKVLREEDSDEEDRARFLREAKALARIEHPNVVRVRALGEADGFVWMAMDYIEGDPLDALLGESPLDEETVLLLGAQLARGLAAVHDVGVLHRDVKPGNCMIDASGRLHLIDFGVACFFTPPTSGGFETQAGVAVGTPHFMSPEQARGDPLTVAADVWGFGCTLYSMLTGKPPFFKEEGEQDMEILARILRERVPSLHDRALEVSQDTGRYVAGLLHKDPHQRPQAFNEIAYQLEALCDKIAVGVNSPGDQIDSHGVQEAIDKGVGGPMHQTAESAPSRFVEEHPSPAASSPPIISMFLMVSTAMVLMAGFGVFLFLGFSDGPSPSNGQQVAKEKDSPKVVRRPIGNMQSSDQHLVLRAQIEKGADPVAVTEVASRQPVVKEDPRPTIEEIVAQIRAEDPPQHEHIDMLLERKNARSAAAVSQLLLETKTAVMVLKRMEEKRTDAYLDQIQEVSTKADPKTSFAIIDALVNIRNVTSIRILEQMAGSHHHGKVRTAAKRAKKKLFKVEDE